MAQHAASPQDASPQGAAAGPSQGAQEGAAAGPVPHGSPATEAPASEEKDLPAVELGASGASPQGAEPQDASPEGAESQPSEPPQPSEPSEPLTPSTGLTAEQVRERESQGLVNRDSSVHTKSYGAIVASHTFTLFNGVNLLLAVLVFLTGSYRNMLFMLVVLANMAIGIFQEARSKHVVDRLSILAARPVRVRRDGRTEEVPSQELVQGDWVLLSSGDQVPADCLVRQGRALLNESLLTGESKPVPKGPGDRLLSGSFVVAGALGAQATAVGAASFAAQINAEAKEARPVRSQILSTLRLIIKLGTWVLLPVGAALFARTYLDGATLDASILSTVAAVVGMIPQGLVLLTSSVLAISTMRLALQNVLVQQLYCIESLARVDVLCLDKTGTITTGSMALCGFYPAPGVSEAELASALVAVMAANAEDANDTAKAVLAYQKDHDLAVPTAQRGVPFSSERKYSGCVLADGRALAVGASQFLLPNDPQALALAAGKAPATARLLAVAQVPGFSADDVVQGEPQLLGVVAVADQVRESAPATLAYFKRQGVQIKVISGDDPRTVSAIAAEAGVEGADRWVDATTLATPEALRQAAAQTVVFGRVTPQQKRDLVLALQAQGHEVAMTGDGVNDVLALREADCSVAMASGSDAARTVAELVLVDDDFAHMPAVVDEGRRSINNLQRSAALFLEKTVFSMVVALICVALPPYPLLPIQLTLVSACVIGIPSFVLALEPNHERVSGGFLSNVLARSVPASVGVSVALGAVVVARLALGLTEVQASTLATVLVAVVGLGLVWCVSRPFNLLRAALLVAMAACLCVGLAGFGWFFEVASLPGGLWAFCAVTALVALAVFAVLYRRGIGGLRSPDSPYVRFARAVEERDHEREERRELRRSR